MKRTTIALYNDRGEQLAPRTFDSAREAAQARAQCRQRLMEVLDKRGDGYEVTLHELAWQVRATREGKGL